MREFERKKEKLLTAKTSLYDTCFFHFYSISGFPEKNVSHHNVCFNSFNNGFHHWFVLKITTHFLYPFKFFLNKILLKINFLSHPTDLILISYKIRLKQSLAKLSRFLRIAHTFVCTLSSELDACAITNVKLELKC